MTLSPNITNYLYGKGHVLFQRTGESGLLHLGNVPDFGLTVEVAKEEHYSAMYGTKEVDKTRITEKKAKATIQLEEFSAENLNLAFLGDGVNTSTQVAGNLDAQSVTTVSDRYVELSRYGLYCTKISHGAVANGPFDVGETITGGTSAATAKVAWVGSGFLEVITVTGTFVSGETITGGTSTATAAATGVETVADAVVTNHATLPTTRYVQGVDYNIQADGGMIREIDAGAIAAHACFVSAQYGGKTLQSIDALVNSSTTGKLVFIGTPEDGPKMRVDCWTCEATISGESKLIGEGISILPLEVNILSDRANHPDHPFFRPIIIS